MRTLNSSEMLSVSGGLVNTNGVDDSGLFTVWGKNDSNQVSSCPKGTFETRPDDYQERWGDPGDCGRHPSAKEIGDAADAASLAMQAKALQSNGGKAALLWGAGALAADVVSTVAGWFEDSENNPPGTGQ